jgi:hypothetical protein
VKGSKKIGSLVDVDLKFSLPLAGTLLVLGIGLGVVFIFFENYRPQFIFIASVIGGLSALYMGYYSAIALRIKIQHDKMQRSFEFTHMLNDIDWARTRCSIIKIKNDYKTESPTALHDKIVADEELHTAIISLLGWLEDVSIAIQHQYVDELILNESIFYIVKDAYENLYPYIQARREKCNHTTLYTEFGKLHHAWREKKSLVTGKALVIE